MVETLRLQEGLKKQEILDTLTELHRENPEVAQPQEPSPEPLPVTEIERELMGV